MTQQYESWRRQAVSVARLFRCAPAARLRSVAVATAVSKLLTLASLGYAARVLGPESWGLVGSSLAAVAYASVLLSPGLMTWGTREIARDRERSRSSLVMVNLPQLVLAVGAFCTVAAVGEMLVAGALARAVLLVSATALFAQALSADWVFDGHERADVPVRLQMVVSAARLAAVVWLCRSPADALRYAAILPLCLGVQALAGYALLYRRGWFRLCWPGLAALGQAARDAWPLGATMALFVLIHNANTLILEAAHGSAATGQYLAALRFVEMASVVPGVLGTVFRPRLARVGWKNPAAAAAEARLFARLHMLAGWLFAPLVFAEAPGIIFWLYGAQYAQAAVLLRIFSVAVLANYLVCGYTNCLVAFGRDRVMLRAMLAAGVVSVGAGCLLTPGWGPAGGAVAASLIHPAGWLVALPAYRRTVGSLELAGWTRPLAAAAAMIGVCWGLDQLGAGPLSRFAAATVVYGAIAGRCWIELQQAALERLSGMPVLEATRPGGAPEKAGRPALDAAAYAENEDDPLAAQQQPAVGVKAAAGQAARSGAATGQEALPC
jgi:O-antigen/teichoic acid export membrane protein